jgi:Glycosyl hydrolase family 76
MIHDDQIKHASRLLLTSMANLRPRKSRMIGAILVSLCVAPLPCARALAHTSHRPHPRSAHRASVGAKARLAGSSHAKKSPKPKLSAAELALQQDTDHAVLGYHAMQKNFYIQGTGLYTGSPQYSFLWPFSQALAATVGMINIPGQSTRYTQELHARMIGLRSYFDATNSGQPEGTFTSALAAFDGTAAPPTGAGGAKYYDDNEWVGIELVRSYETTGEAAALESAEQIMAFVMSGWQANPKLACSGGVPFSNAASNGTRNTVTTAPGAELALQLYGITANPEYLQFAEMAYAWVRQCTLSANGLYADHIGSKGVVEPTEWSYNQGTMIGAGVMLYQATNNGAFLYQARQTAKAALAYFTPERLGGENPFFVTVYFRNLLYLDSLTGDPPGPRIAQTYVNFLATKHLSSSGLFSTAGYPSQLLVQASIIEIYELLSTPPATYF